MIEHLYRKDREKMEKRMRSSNIELLRIVAMFMIIMYHIAIHVVRVQITNQSAIGEAAAFFNRPVFIPRILLVNVAMTFGIVSNAIFILISGYFMANRGGG